MEIDAGGTSSGDSGGFVLITTAGDVLLRRPVSVSNGLDGEDRGYGGRFIIFTDGDLRIDRPIRALHGGSVFLAAGNDLLVNASVLTQGGRSQGVSFQAGRDLVLGKPGGRRLRIDTNAAQRVPCGERFNLSGSLTTLHSGRDTVVGSNVLFTGIGAVGDEECTVLGRPRGGQYTAFARGTFSMAGAIVTEARGPFGVPAPISIRSEDSIDIRPEAVIQASGNYADFISINASRSARISGHVSAVADSAGGSLSFSADKLSIDGTIEGGGDRNGGAAFFSGCDVALQPGATIDLSHGTQGGHQSSVRFKVGGAMSAAPESVVVGNPESKIEVLYSPTSPLPVLDGTIQPTPSLTEDPTIVPCQ